MERDDNLDETYGRLRRLVASDPKQARQVFGDLQAGQPGALDGVLERASRPGEGRVRQMIATTVRLNGSTGTLERWLRQWMAVESDGFARDAIAAAIAAGDPEPPPAVEPLEMPAHFVEAYRYAAERLCHRVRGPLTRSAALLLRLERLAQKIIAPAERSEATGLYADLQSFVQRLGRVVEFDIDEAYLRWQAVALGRWLEDSAPGFAGRFGPAILVVEGAPEARTCAVRANRFLLETAFGNLWVNAIQAAETAGSGGCRITAELRLDGGWLEVLVRDGGPGFSREQVETAFRLPFSTKSETRGRGLLEIAEAIGRLHGEIRLFEASPDEYRILIRIPAENL